MTERVPALSRKVLPKKCSNTYVAKSANMPAKNALAKQYQRFFEMEGVNLIFTPESLQEVATLARERGTGARALRAILEDIMLELMYEIPSNTNIKEIVITEEAVARKAKPLIALKEEKATA